MTAEPGPFRPVLESEAFRELQSRVEHGATHLAVSGLVEASRGLVVSALARRLRRRILVVVPDDPAMDGWRRDLGAVMSLSGRDGGRIAILPALDADPYDDIPSHPEVVRERVVTLGRIDAGDVDIVVAPARTLLTWLPSRDEWTRRTRTVRIGDDLPPDRFVPEALALGYRRVDVVSGPGELSRRGGILDIFPPRVDEPVRIELFGDTVDSLRSFDTDHQRSTGNLSEVVIGPAAEGAPSVDGVDRLRDYLDRGARRAEGDRLKREFARRLDTLINEGFLPGLEALTALTAERPVTLMDHVAGYLTVVDEPERCDDAVLRADHEARQSFEQSGNRVLPPPTELQVPPGRVRDALANADVGLRELTGDEPADVSSVVSFRTRGVRAYHGRVADLAADLGRARDDGNVTLCVMRGTGGAERLGEILREYEIETPSAAVTIGVGALRTGFEFPELGLTVLTEREIFGEPKKTETRRKSASAAFVSDFHDLKVGDLVVHVDHGVARFGGLGRPKGGSLNRDFMTLTFAAGDRLFVPVDRLDLVQKYSGVAGSKPALDRLGGVGWSKVKARVQKSVESIAGELLELYAQRKAIRGHEFGADTPWQNEMEEAFEFEPTVDQARAVRDSKEDMESTLPMDRLLVGDVGFGKTEVAIRAAFKAVMDGRQVAVLAPTTVLVFQHHETFRRRYAAFPVRVEMVTRFQTAAQVRKILDAVATGEVDVLIGTHRMLSKDVAFAKLGLMIVDEEQRFGVKHKERLKQMAIGIDVLSMTATPIPRTLQMSLAGVRDLSLIETPPRGRTAIQTYVLPWRNNVLTQAIRQELRRDGQVFVVHNRIETLPALVRAIGEMVPEARIVMAHGRMRDHQLERVMLQFIGYEADVLVTTTIVENGLDIPRANTLIVNRADRFGLAQLYQLRGRVGRSEQHAYAYFVVPSREHLGQEAHRRLRALQEFSELGAGFRLAAADLEIRGAGELLGSRQHGHIASLGFDMYVQMLERAVRERQGDVVEEREPVTLHLGIDIKVPDSYMPQSGDRLALYKRLAGCRDDDDVERLEADTEDRFGQLPPPGRNLFAMGRLRVLAESAHVKSIDVADGKIQVRFTAKAEADPERVLALLRKRGGSITPSGMLLVPAPTRPADRIRVAGEVVREFLEAGKGP